MGLIAERGRVHGFIYGQNKKKEGVRHDTSKDCLGKKRRWWNTNPQADQERLRTSPGNKLKMGLRNLEMKDSLPRFTKGRKGHPPCSVNSGPLP